MEITEITARRLEYDLAATYHPSWVPGATQTSHEVDLYEVHTDEGVSGLTAFPPNPGDDDPTTAYESHLVGMNPYEIESIRPKLDSLAFLGTEPWHIEVALWDLIGKDLGLPIYRLLGGTDSPVRIYASTAERRPPEQRVEDVQDRVDEGFPAVKLRFGEDDLEDDLAVARAVREAFPDLTLMVDANMGWSIRVSGVERRWSFTEALTAARALEELGDVAWLEEPLPQRQYGRLADLRRRTDIAIAGGESVGGLDVYREYIDHGSLDILQPDAIFATGIRGGKTIAELASLHGLSFAPHTWSNGIGLAANLHLIAASDARWCEYPIEPPAWDEAARDFMLAEPLSHDDGMITPPNGPGLGIELDDEAIAATTVETFD